MTSVGSMYHSGDKIPFMMLVSARPEKGALQNIYFDLTAAYHAVESTQFRRRNGTRIQNRRQAVQRRHADRFPGAQRRFGGTGRDRRVSAGAKPSRESADWLNAASSTGNVLANLMLARVYQLEARDLEGDARKEAMEFVLEHICTRSRPGPMKPCLRWPGSISMATTAKTTSNRA